MGVGRIVSFELRNRGVLVSGAKQEEKNIIIGTIGFQGLKAKTIQINIFIAEGEKTEGFEGFGLHIPDYQRPYAWEEKQVETLLNDLKDVIESGKKSYLLGSLIFHQNTDSSTLDIVDGQQRLVTLALICAELEQWKQGEDDENWHRKQTQLDDNSFLMGQNFPHSESQKNLKNNFAYIGKWFERNQNEVGKFRELLLGEKNNKIEFVCIVTLNLDDAFIFFDSANSKGKKLEDYDLIKAYHLREIKGLKSIKKYAQNFENLAKDSDNFEKLFRWILAPSRRWVRGEQIDATKISLYDEFCQEIPKKFRKEKNPKSKGTLEFTHSFLGGKDFFEYLNKYSHFVKKIQENDELYLEIPNKDSTFFYVGYLYLSLLCLCYSKFQDNKILEEFYSRIFRIVASIRVQVLKLGEARMRYWGCKIFPKIFWITYKHDFDLIFAELDKMCEEEEKEKKNDTQGYQTIIQKIIEGQKNVQ